VSPSNPLRPPPPARGRCGFTGATGQCQNPGRWDRDGVLSCTTHKNASNPVPFERGQPQSTRSARPASVGPATQSSAPVSELFPPRAALGGLRRYPKSEETWWQKPLIECLPNPKPAELIILREEVQAAESGVWLNSRSTTTGVIDLVRHADGRLRTVRSALPAFVSELLSRLYRSTGLRKGAPDVVIWSDGTRTVRFIEVKCPHWDHVSVEQEIFLRAASAAGCSSSIVEWEFIV